MSNDPEMKKAVFVRVLVAFRGANPGDLATVLADDVQALTDSGVIDAHQDAVAYAKKNNAPKIDLTQK